MLEELRGQIDQLDQQLLTLLEQRLALVREVGEVKREQGLPIYAPDREASMLAQRRAEAEDRGLNPDLIEDILRRCMRESYQQEVGAGSKCLRPGLGKVVVVGGAGRLGHRFVQYFQASGYEVTVLEKDDWPRAEALLAGAGLVVLSVPIDQTLAVIEALPPLPEGCTLVDLTSTKVGPLAAMLAKHPGPVLGLHPMFGPDVSSFAKEVVLYCQGRGDNQWLVEQMMLWGVKMVAVEAAEHDGAMGFIQALRHFTSLAYGIHLMEEGADIPALLTMSSPIYRLELAMVGRLFAQSPELYADIILSNGSHLELIRRFQLRLAKVTELLESRDKAALVARFKEVAAFFGPRAQEFLRESRLLLAQSKDSRRG
ncbi:bifunctional chorismate mutase/prephenate dehydrogenase [Gallaecimonas kandeliae]|uniref:bifunctional chorismate mutase/prephenate dehydrogenase n=1 Tax=Gallaecimonas kandeliae TaxID=3029055 RepID=UPI0026479443|nr:bifunctional chorismate mutase/prephenate dehydrogenase [Gallaecimonas kandeliae]WKE63922.1 bifunctional chorismate mutase/prephenate dehydrogenase [Gallaecimonas kandeliae]